MIIDAMHRKSHFADGDRGSRATVPCLIAWQHEDIALKTKTGDPGDQRGNPDADQTTGTLNVPTSWPVRQLARAAIWCSFSIGQVAAGR